MLMKVTGEDEAVMLCERFIKACSP